jgi:tetraacyldisaccharide 4'-kinase
VVVITNADAITQHELEPIEREVMRHMHKQPLLAAYVPTAARAVFGGQRKELRGFAGKDVVAFSAIGQNEGFRKSLERCGMRVVEHITYRDHHWYTHEDLATILSRSPGSCPLFTTTKDAVRLVPWQASLPGDRLFALETELTFIRGEDEWQKSIHDALQCSSTATGR